jgi:hypothetical protein
VFGLGGLAYFVPEARGFIVFVLTFIATVLSVLRVVLFFVEGD